MNKYWAIIKYSPFTKLWTCGICERKFRFMWTIWNHASKGCKGDIR